MKYTRNNYQFINREGTSRNFTNKERIQPDIYEEYLVYYTKGRQFSPNHISFIRRLLSTFNDYLIKSNINISSIRIAQLDCFLMRIKGRLAPSTFRSYLYYLRHFLRYLYHECGILDTDLSPLLVLSLPRGQVRPPNYLRPNELQKLFASIGLSSKKDARTYAILHLAYTLGLLPREICMITLDDIHFIQGEIKLRSRRSEKSFILPLSNDTLKSIALYMIKARPHNNERALFLKSKPPHVPISPSIVSNDLRRVMRKVNLVSSSYCLRHTYAKNLLENGASLFEIREMLGHALIQTAKGYLQIHTKLIRKVLFDEIF
jgi:integrase/recombinase XerD